MGSDDGYIYSIDANTGYREMETPKLRLDFTTHLVAFNDMIYVGSFDRSFYAFEALSGRVRWKTILSDFIISSPAFDENIISWISRWMFYAHQRNKWERAWK